MNAATDDPKVQPKPRARPNWAIVSDTQTKLEAAQAVIAEHECSLAAALDELAETKRRAAAELDAAWKESFGLRSRLAYFWRWQWFEIPVLLLIGAVIGKGLAS